MSKSIVIITSLDTKGEEALFLKGLIETRGHRVVLTDIGTGAETSIKADYTSKEVAKAGGGDIQVIRKMKDTEKASGIMIKGAVKKIRSLLEKSELDGIISFGGGSNTTVATTIMKSLPFGIAKVMLSSTASIPAYAGEYFGRKDIAILHSVVDIAGLNPLVRDVLQRAAGMVCGMVEMGEGPSVLSREKKEDLIALTEFKFSEKCSSHARHLLEERGFRVIPFHAQGISDRAMEELIEEGFFHGVVDIVPAGVSEELFGGNRAAGPRRLEIAGKMGLPQIITPCGFDMISCGPIERGEKGDPLWISRDLKNRKLFIADSFRVAARTIPEELKLVAGEVARKLNMAKGPVTFLIPQKGWSQLDEEGMPLYDPNADKVFVEALKKLVDPKIRIVELALQLNTKEFAEMVVKYFLSMYE